MHGFAFHPEFYEVLTNNFVVFITEIISSPYTLVVNYLSSKQASSVRFRLWAFLIEDFLFNQELLWYWKIILIDKGDKLNTIKSIFWCLCGKSAWNRNENDRAAWNWNEKEWKQKWKWWIVTSWQFHSRKIKMNGLPV